MGQLSRLNDKGAHATRGNISVGWNDTYRHTYTGSGWSLISEAIMEDANDDLRCRRMQKQALDEYCDAVVGALILGNRASGIGYV